MSETLGVRRAEDGDVAHVSDLVNARPEAYLERFGTVAVEQVVEKHFLSVVFTETDGRVVGLAAFNDSPRPGQEADEWVDWSRRTFGQDFLTCTNSLWLSFFVCDEAHTFAAGELMSQTLFSTLPEIDLALFLHARDAPLFEPVGSTFDAFDGSMLTARDGPDPGFTVLALDRRSFAPDLKIRIARVEDHDDLAPIFSRQSASLNAAYGDFFLAELIESQDEANKALVAEADGRAVGLVALSTDIDVGVLQRCFDLEPFGNLVKDQGGGGGGGGGGSGGRSSHESPGGGSDGSGGAGGSPPAPGDWLSVLEAHWGEVRDMFAGSAEEGELTTAAALRASLAEAGPKWGYPGGAELGEDVLYELRLVARFASASALHMATAAGASAEEEDAHTTVAWETLASGVKAEREARSRRRVRRALLAWCRGDAYSGGLDGGTEHGRAALEEAFLLAVGMGGAEVTAEALATEGGGSCHTGNLTIALNERHSAAWRAMGAEATAGGESLGEVAVRELGLGGGRDEGGKSADGGGRAVTWAQLSHALEAFEDEVMAERYQEERLHVVVAGPPAAGKGTQCEAMSSRYGLVHVSSGDLLRAAAAAGTDLGQEAAEYMNGGELVPEDLVAQLVHARLAQVDCRRHGWLLDGFPRTSMQVQLLEEATGGGAVDALLVLEVPEEVLLSRITGRRVDPETGRVYHEHSLPPESEEVAARLVQREDDTLDRARVALEEYRDGIEPVVEAYREAVVHVDAGGEPDVVAGATLGAVDAVAQMRVRDAWQREGAASASAPGAGEGGGGGGGGGGRGNRA